MGRESVWADLRGGGRRYLRGAAPWRAAAYVGGGALVGVPVLVTLVASLAVGVVLSVFLVGLPLLAALAFVGLPVAALERRRLRSVDPAPAPSPHRAPDAPGLTAWLRLRVREQATWRELAYAVLMAFVLWPLDLAAAACTLALPLLLAGAPAHLALTGGPAEGGVRPAKLWLVESYPAACGTAVLGLALLVALLYPLGAYAAARAALARLLLAPREAETRAQLAEVTRSRARLVTAFEAERRRVERDLHDGAQQRLVALSMTLGLARLDAEAGSPLAARLASAHGEADAVLAELRELIRGIHPQVLADYGLPAAIEDAADRSPVPVDVAVDSGAGLPRLSEPVESAAYFAVREALTNVARHSGATRAAVRARHADGALRLTVRDDGTGGADPARGSGLTGLADRLAVLDGTLTVTSPPGGPTVLTLEIPCTPRPPSGPAPTE
ncbi:sensor histidine kinase [Streptomyces flavofungini]|uniref:histidine kinase n=1 Tax=Streptomyces flavofungini TaxID=68200 RepID=A0ABS0XDX4_9ACTN|nr:sensor histidine kinase [Streptomyces flavofungini]MBJ3811114.1 sensor histidine kinase [Streptomyces flavofungini]GHC43983.1 histidine kinase [Streptomyces flavofungini]